MKKIIRNILLLIVIAFGYWFTNWMPFDNEVLLAQVDEEQEEKLEVKEPERKQGRLKEQAVSRFTEQEIGDNLYILTDKNSGVHYLQLADPFGVGLQLSTIPLINADGLPVTDEHISKHRFKITQEGDNRLILDTISDVEYLVISKSGYESVEIIPLLNSKGDFGATSQKPKIQY